MRIYTVHLRATQPRSEADLRLVKEGFSWPAFLFGPLWALSHRMVWTALALLAVLIVVRVGLRLAGAGEEAAAAAGLGAQLLIGLWGNDLRRLALSRKGFMEKDVVAAGNADAALGRWCDRWGRVTG